MSTARAVLLLAVLLLAGCNEAVERVEGSSLARWWRCLGSSRPLLADDSAIWTLEYSWTHGFGPGDIHLELSHDGSLELRVVQHEQEVRVVRAQASASEVARIAAAVDTVGLLCLESRPREDHHIVDLGTYRIGVEDGTYTKDVRAGECEFVDDPAAFDAVVQSIEALAPLVGDELTWGPYGSTTMPGGCGEEAS